jgi:hypothetical protein
MPHLSRHLTPLSRPSHSHKKLPSNSKVNIVLDFGIFGNDVECSYKNTERSEGVLKFGTPRYKPIFSKN